MGVLAVTKIWSGRGAGFSSDERTYKQVFQVITDTFATGPLEVAFATGIPRWGEPYVTDTEYDYGAFALKIDPQQQDDPNNWHVAVDYSSRVPEDKKQELAQKYPNGSAPSGRGGGPGGGGKPKSSNAKREGDKGQGFNPSDNPLNKPPEISWDYQQFQKPATNPLQIGVQEGRKGKQVFPFVPWMEGSVTNTSGEPFEGLQMDDSRPVLTITQNLATYDHKQSYRYSDTLNNKEFLGYAKRTAKIQRIAATFGFESGTPFWRRTVEIHFRDEGWDDVVANIGHRIAIVRTLAQVQAGLSPFKVLREKNGAPITKAAYLSKDGYRVLAKEETPIYIVFRWYYESDFGQLDLPMSVLEVPKVT